MVVASQHLHHVMQLQKAANAGLDGSSQRPDTGLAFHNEFSEPLR